MHRILTLFLIPFVIGFMVTKYVIHRVPSPAFQVGDCVQRTSPDAETWDVNDNDIHKIKEIGRKSYRTEHVIELMRGPSIIESTIRFQVQDRYVKVKCPNNLQEGLKNGR